MYRFFVTETKIHHQDKLEYFLWCISGINHYKSQVAVTSFWATSMLVTDDGDEMCWWQFENVGNGFGHFSHQHSKIVTSSKSPTWQCRQHDCSPLGLPFSKNFDFWLVTIPPYKNIHTALSNTSWHQHQCRKNKSVIMTWLSGGF